MVEAGLDLGLVAESLHEIGVGGELGVEGLDRHGAVQGGVETLVNLAHAAFADQRFHPVVGNHGAGYQHQTSSENVGEEKLGGAEVLSSKRWGGTGREESD